MAIRKFAECMYQLSPNSDVSHFVTAHFSPLQTVITKILTPGKVTTLVLSPEELEALCESWEHHKARKAATRETLMVKKPEVKVKSKP